MLAMKDRPDIALPAGTEEPIVPDTVPADFRSEAFAEDLDELQATASQPRVSPRKFKATGFPMLLAAVAGTLGLLRS
jgi:hypothetical protein